MGLQNGARMVLYVTAAIVTAELVLAWFRKSAGHNCVNLLSGRVATGPGCSDTASLSPGEDPWEQMKWIGRPSKQRVRGHLIEELDPENNFRRGFALAHCPRINAECVENKLHLLPWMLGTYEDLDCAPRRVLLDLGARHFNTSVQWFMTYYPADFTEVHAFERMPGWFTVPEDKDENVVLDERAIRRRETPPKVPQWQRSRVQVHEKYVSVSDREGGSFTQVGGIANKDKEATIDITRFIKEELKIRPEDALIVKMDVEGEEWKILPAWAKDPEMVTLIDEIFVEFHYHHPSMVRHGWTSNVFKWTRDEVVELFQGLRNKGFFIHAWP